MWLCPCRHHWLLTMPLAVSAIASPFGDGAAQYSEMYRSWITGIGVPPVLPTRNTLDSPPTSC